MAVFRVKKTKDYTVMANHHLRNTSLSLKAKGLLSLMLSLPENWDYTTKGLAHICKDGVDSIRAGVCELEAHGYVIRERVRNANGQLDGIVYTILEQPNDPVHKQEKPEQENPVQETPIQEEPEQGNPAQLNIDRLNNQKPKKDLSSIDSIPSGPIATSVAEDGGMKRKERSGSCLDIYRKIIMENISYDLLLDGMPYDHDRLEEVLELIVETVCSGKTHIRVAGTDYPAEVVKARFLKLNKDHIQFVFDCLKENTTRIRNIKQYLLTTLYNAPATIGNYYSARVQHDLYRNSRD